MIEKNQTSDFLKALYGNKPTGGYILLWQKDDKRSNWFTDIDKAVEFATGKSNVYVGVGLSPTDNGSSKRCTADKINAIAGHFIDMDIAGPGHKKANLPESMEKAKAIIEKFPLKPTAIIDSGHGLQAWWLFDQLWRFDSSEERRQAQTECRRFNHTFKALAAPYEVDSTFDLARVLRIPGTINSKDGMPDVPAELIKLNGVRYSPLDFDAHMIPADQLSEDKKASAISATQVKGLLLDPTAEPPADKLDALSEIDPKFKAAWMKKRDDLPSASEYDLSLASVAAAAGWPDQEIADLLIAWRRRHAEDPAKALRTDYIGSTIARAKQKSENLSRDNALSQLSAALGLKVHSLTKFRADMSYYILSTDKGDVELKSTRVLRSQMFFEDSVCDSIEVELNLSRKVWPKIRSLLMDVVQVEAVAGEAVATTRVAERLCRWLIGRRDKAFRRSDIFKETSSNPNQYKSLSENYELRVVIDHDGSILFRMDNFFKWYGLTYGNEDKRSCVTSSLRKMKCSGDHKVDLMLDGKRTSWTYWKVPKSVCAWDSSWIKTASDS